jgi:hypothetical protein
LGDGAFSVAISQAGADPWSGPRLELLLDTDEEKNPSVICFSGETKDGTILLAEGVTERLVCAADNSVLTSLYDVELDENDEETLLIVDAMATVTGVGKGDDSDNAYMSAQICYGQEEEQTCCDNKDEVFDSPGDDYVLGARDVFEAIGSCKGFKIPVSYLKRGDFSVTLNHNGTDPWAGTRAEILFADEDQSGVVCNSAAAEDGVIRLSKGVTEALRCWVKADL